MQVTDLAAVCWTAELLACFPPSIHFPLNIQEVLYSKLCWHLAPVSKWRSSLDFKPCNLGIREPRQVTSSYLSSINIPTTPFPETRLISQCVAMAGIHGKPVSWHPYTHLSLTATRRSDSCWAQTQRCRVNILHRHPLPLGLYLIYKPLRPGYMALMKFLNSLASHIGRFTILHTYCILTYHGEKNMHHYSWIPKSWLSAHMHASVRQAV